ncbi:MAG: CBS domain-containing protein, partial [Chromatiaceae bacterium]|nr:CBS domain-containing protein [Chromatiaceae bacterium]
MTRELITVESDATLVHSLSVMFDHKFRHLPVLENGQVAGVLSCRDIPANY